MNTTYNTWQKNLNPLAKILYNVTLATFVGCNITHFYIGRQVVILDPSTAAASAMMLTFLTTILDIYEDRGKGKEYHEYSHTFFLVTAGFLEATVAAIVYSSLFECNRNLTIGIFAALRLASIGLTRAIESEIDQEEKTSINRLYSICAIPTAICVLKYFNLIGLAGTALLALKWISGFINCTTNSGSSKSAKRNSTNHSDSDSKPMNVPRADPLANASAPPPDAAG